MPQKAGAKVDPRSAAKAAAMRALGKADDGDAHDGTASRTPTKVCVRPACLDQKHAVKSAYAGTSVAEYVNLHHRLYHCGKTQSSSSGLTLA